MLIYWNKLLTALGCQLTSGNINELHPCPFHPNTEKTLTINTDSFTNDLQFTCKKCSFTGDFLTLVSRLYNTDIITAFNLFTPGNTLYHTLTNELNSFQSEEYLNLRKNQVLIDDYILRCHEYLTTNPEGKQLCLYLTNHQWIIARLNQLPKEVGYAISENIPSILTRLIEPDYKQASHLLFRYTFNNITTKLTTLKIGDINKYTEIPLNSNDNGIFLESNLTNTTQQIFITQDELTALAIHTKLKTWNDNNYPVITVTSLHLPNYCTSLDKLIFVTTPQKPLTITTALGYFTTKNIIEHSNRCPTLYITEVAQSINKLPVNVMMQRILTKKPLLAWLANELIYNFNTIGTAPIHEALKNIQFTETQKMLLLTELSTRTCPQELYKIIQNHNITICEQKTLINGKTIIKTHTGFVGYKATKIPIPLSNISFTVKQKIQTNTGELYCDCELFPADPDIPKIHAFLPYTAFKYYKTLQHVIVKAYADAGYAPSIILYNKKDFDWMEICDMFTESKLVQTELKHLGLDEHQVIQLPELSIDARSKLIKPQNKIFAMPDYIRTTYTGFGCNELTSINTFKTLWTNHNPSLYPFIAGVCHILTNLIISTNGLNFKQQPQLKHLCLVNTPDYPLNNTYTKLNMLITGNANEYKLTTYNINKFLESSIGMGELPLLVRLPELMPTRRKMLIQDTPASLILNVTNSIAEEFNDFYNVVFVTGRDTTQLTTEFIFALRNEFVSFIINIMGSPLLEKYIKQIVCSCIPQVETFEFIAEHFGIDVTKNNINDCVKSYYIDNSSSTITAFFDALKPITGNTIKHPVKLISLHSEPSSSMLTDRNLNIYSTDACVYIRKSLTEFINKQNVQRHFKQRGLTGELERAGLLINHLPNYWVIQKDKWDKFVRTEPETILALK